MNAEILGKAAEEKRYSHLSAMTQKRRSASVQFTTGDQPEPRASAVKVSSEYL